MKIAMIGHKRVPSREGGVEIVVEQLSIRMASLGNDVTLFNRKRKEYKKIDTYKECKVEEVFSINKKSLDALVYSFFATVKAKHGHFDIVHFHAEGSCAFLWMLGRKHKKFKVVVTIHGLDWQRGKWGGFATKFLKYCERQAVKHADKIIVLSENNKNYFKNTYNRETEYIPNGIDKPIFKEPNIITKEYGLTKNSYVLFLARIVPEKGLHYLIEAWKRIENKKGLKLVIAGGSSHTSEYFNEIISMTKDDPTIIMTGFVQGDKLYELYSNAFLYVLPSDIEGMPMSLLEAMSYGNRCLVSNIPENMEIINENCSSFVKGDVDSLYKVLIILIESINQKNAKTQKMKDWDAITQETINLYKSFNLNTNGGTLYESIISE